MAANRYKKLGICMMALVLSGCGLFGKKTLDISGERIDVVREDVSLAPDVSISKLHIKLPEPYTNPRWSQTGGNAVHLMGHLNGASDLTKIWSKSFGAGNSKRDKIISTPIIAYNAVFAIDADGKVSARRLDNGKQIWKKRLKPRNDNEKNTAFKGVGLAEFNKKIYVTSGFGTVFCLDMLNGEEIWRQDLNVPFRIAPTVAAGRIIVQSFDNSLLALDAENGEIIWKNQHDFENTTVVGGATPAYNSNMDVIIAAFSNGEIQAFKASTGTPLWSNLLVSEQNNNSLSDINAIKASPIIDEDKVFAIGCNSILTSIDLRTGHKIWEREIEANSQPWISGEYLFVLSKNFDLIALNKNNGKIMWNTAIPQNEDFDNKSGVFGSGPILVKNRLLVTSSDGYVFAISPYDGKILSYIATDAGVELPPVVAEETVVFITNKAKMTAYK